MIASGDLLSDAELQACKKLKKRNDKPDDTDTTNQNSENMSTLQKVNLQLESFAKKQKKSHIQGQFSASSGYIDVDLLIRPTSNTCERIFSESGYILPAHRRCMSPKTFEALLLLKKNKEDWNEFTVAQAMKEDGLSSEE
jgi:hypothetical protein